MSETRTTGRQPWLAAVLALFCTGLGHVYCGRIVKGVVLFLVSLAFVPAAVATALLGAATAVLVGLIASCVVAVGVYVYAAVDSYRIARGLREGYVARDYNRGVVYAFFILVGVAGPSSAAALIRAHALEAYYCPSLSMEPSLLRGDRFLIGKLAPGGRRLRRGDVVVFEVPDGSGQRYVKRVIGLPGDRVAVVGREVILNGERLRCEPVSEAALASVRSQLSGEVFDEVIDGRRHRILLGAPPTPTPDCPETPVPDGACFVLGDNRDQARDSRHYGCVPLVNVLGGVRYVFWPAGAWARFGAFVG